MKFGLSFLPDATPQTKSAPEYFRDVLALSDTADRAGLHYVKMTEHYLHPYGGYCPNPLGFLAAVAARTERIRLMTGCVIPAFHHPVQLASEAAMVDTISSGRLDVGFARGYLAYEFDTFRVPLDESRARYEATIRSVLDLWTHETVDASTPFFRFQNASILPRPVQRPHPPIWGAAVRSRQSFAAIAEMGMGLLVTVGLGTVDDLVERIDIYREVCRDLQPKTPGSVVLSMPLFLDEDEDCARREGDHYLQRALDVWGDAAECLRTSRSVDYPGYGTVVYAIRNTTPAGMRASGNALIGSPERIVDEIHDLVARLDLDGILWNIEFGAMGYEPSARTLGLFLDQVAPRIDVSPPWSEIP